MVAPQKCSRRCPSPAAWHAAFLAMLPTIAQYARVAFRGLKPEAREDAVQEVIANCLVAFARLVELGKANLAYPTVLARYGIAQVRTGRRVGNRLRIGEVLSEYAQQQKDFRVERLDRYDEKEGQWIEVVVEDPHAGPAETAAARIDLGEWFGRMTPRKRRIAQALAVGGRTSDVARKFRLSPGRISQMRDEFRASWNDFQGGQAAATA